jgi:hypothetical protein
LTNLFDESVTVLSDIGGKQDEAQVQVQELNNHDNNNNNKTATNRFDDSVTEISEKDNGAKELDNHGNIIATEKEEMKELVLINKDEGNNVGLPFNNSTNPFVESEKDNYISVVAKDEADEQVNRDDEVMTAAPPPCTLAFETDEALDDDVSSLNGGTGFLALKGDNVDDKVEQPYFGSSRPTLSKKGSHNAPGDMTIGLWIALRLKKYSWYHPSYSQTNFMKEMNP